MGVQQYLGSLRTLAVERIFGLLRNSHHQEECRAHSWCLHVHEKKEGIRSWKPDRTVLIPGEAV